MNKKKSLKEIHAMLVLLCEEKGITQESVNAKSIGGGGIKPPSDDDDDDNGGD